MYVLAGKRLSSHCSVTCFYFSSSFEFILNLTAVIPRIFQSRYSNRTADRSPSANVILLTCTPTRKCYLFFDSESLWLNCLLAHYHYTWLDRAWMRGSKSSVCAPPKCRDTGSKYFYSAFVFFVFSFIFYSWLSFGLAESELIIPVFPRSWLLHDPK